LHHTCNGFARLFLLLILLNLPWRACNGKQGSKYNTGKSRAEPIKVKIEYLQKKLIIKSILAWGFRDGFQFSIFL
jgi:hypothetical protein